MKILFIGCGLIGGSVAKALIGKAEIHTLTVKPISHQGIISHTKDVPVSDFDIICISTPCGRNYEIYKEAFERAAGLSTKNTLIVDVSSVQNRNEYFQEKYHNFTPCHPIAGTERSGFENSDPAIIFNKNCIVIGTNPPKEVSDFWHSAGMKTVNIASTARHDEIFAKISHLPQLISFNMKPKQKYPVFYRLCSSPQNIWTEIFLHNGMHIGNALEQFKSEVHKLANSGFPFEKIIGTSLLKICNEEEKSFAGTGFSSITSCERIQELSVSGYRDAVSVIKNAEDFLLSVGL